MWYSTKGCYTSLTYYRFGGDTTQNGATNSLTYYRSEDGTPQILIRSESYTDSSSQSDGILSDRLALGSTLSQKKKQQKNMTTWGFHMKTKTARIDTDILTRNALAAYKCESTDTVLPVWHANVKDTDIIFRLHKTVPHSTNLLQILGWYSTKQCHTDHQLTTNSRMVLHKTVPHTSLIYYKF